MVTNWDILLSKSKVSNYLKYLFGKNIELDFYMFDQ